LMDAWSQSTASSLQEYVDDKSRFRITSDDKHFGVKSLGKLHATAVDGVRLVVYQSDCRVQPHWQQATGVGRLPLDRSNCRCCTANAVRRCEAGTASLGDLASAVSLR
jgi:hypothetical protein